MSQYFTFDGNTFHNKVAYKTLTIQTKEKQIDNKSYLFFVVIDQDSNIIYESPDYKIKDGKYEVPNMYGNFKQALKNAISIIESL